MLGLCAVFVGAFVAVAPLEGLADRPELDPNELLPDDLPPLGIIIY